MGTKWKPVQPTEIKDINIVREVITQIRRPVPMEIARRHKALDKYIDAMLNKK
jgi:hypothetical protein